MNDELKKHPRKIYIDSNVLGNHVVPTVLMANGGRVIADNGVGTTHLVGVAAGMATFNATLSLLKVLTRPPKSASYLLYLFLPLKDRESIPGDLAEEYATIILPEFGVRQARFWYWKQVICSVWPIIGSRFKRIITIGGVGKAVYEIWKRLGL